MDAESTVKELQHINAILLGALKTVSSQYQQHFDAMPVAWQSVDNIVQSAITQAEFLKTINDEGANTEAPAPSNDTTTGKKGAATVKYTERDQFLLDIITTAREGGINYWADTRDAKIDEEHNCLSFKVRDSEDWTAEWAVVDASVIQLGIERSIGGGIVSPKRAAQIHAANQENDAGNIDADLADCIVQAGLFHEIIFS